MVVTVPNYQAIETLPLAAGAEVTGVLLDERDGGASTSTPSAQRCGRPRG